MEFWTALKGKLDAIISPRPDLQVERPAEGPVSAQEEEEMYSCVSILSHDPNPFQTVPETAPLAYKPQQTPETEPWPTAPTQTPSLGGEEGETAFLVRNLTTGEFIDLRDENDPGFPQKYAQVLTLSKDPDLYL